MNHQVRSSLGQYGSSGHTVDAAIWSWHNAGHRLGDNMNHELLCMSVRVRVRLCVHMHSSLKGEPGL